MSDVSYNSLGNEIRVTVSIDHFSNRDKLSLLRTLLIETGIIEALVLDSKRDESEQEFGEALRMLDQKFTDFWNKA